MANTSSSIMKTIINNLIIKTIIKNIIMKTIINNSRLISSAVGM